MESEVLSHEELIDAWPALSESERREGFLLLSRVAAEELFFRLDAAHQAELILSLAPSERRLWMRALPPDDAADVLQAVEPEQREALASLLDDVARTEVAALLAYAEDEAGGLMNPRFARLRPDMSVDEAISYLRRQTRERVEDISYAYVLDARQKLLGVVSLRELVSASPGRVVRDMMRTDLVTAHEEMDQEAVSQLFAEHDLMSLPVVDAEGRMKGIVTVDDIVDVVREEATEDIQKIGGVVALDAPYLETPLRAMLRKRMIWLVVLFLGQTLTVSVMDYFHDRIVLAAAVLNVFIPLIISSGGNAGSQAATLVVRALSLGEVRLRDWAQVIRMEVVVGLSLGGVLAILGLLRVLVGGMFGMYGEHFMLVASAVALSLLGVVAWGATVGSMLPLVMRRLGFDPASASTPFVATLCDVTGLLIYFSIAMAVLSGALL